jgi:hypothetical protein
MLLVERSGTVWLSVGLWKLKRIGRNTDKGRWPLCLGEEDIKHILLSCSETINWRMEFLNKNG